MGHQVLSHLCGTYVSFDVLLFWIMHVYWDQRWGSQCSVVSEVCYFWWYHHLFFLFHFLNSYTKVSWLHFELNPLGLKRLDILHQTDSRLQHKLACHAMMELCQAHFPAHCAPPANSHSCLLLLLDHACCIYHLSTCFSFLLWQHRLQWFRGVVLSSSAAKGVFVNLKQKTKLGRILCSITLYHIVKEISVLSSLGN